MKKKILVIDDEKDIIELLKYNLEREGYQVICAENGEVALNFVKKEKPDLVVLDLMLPGMDGLTVCKILKRDENTASIPIIMLTAKDTESDVIVGLEVGADDYITKPFSPRVLIARIKAVLRRKTETLKSEEIVKKGDLVIDTIKHTVNIKDKPLELTITEFRILGFLAKNQGKAFNRDQILNNAWAEEPFIIDRAVDVHVRALRKKLGKLSNLIETVRGVGYRFKE